MSDSQVKCRHAVQVTKIFVAGALTGLALCLGASSVQAQMTTPGQYSVSQSGAATYSIPIQIPPGVAGMEPKLALTYDSQAGNGVVGIGWSLSGLSAITNCRGGYCLDGQYLVPISGVNGANNTEYRTERDGYSKIVSYTESGTTIGPGSFIVKTKAGLAMEFGKTVDSRVNFGKPNVLTWALNKVVDAKGNFYTITYVNGTAEYYPSRIDYTANTMASPTLGATNTVFFDYETRPDTRSTYPGLVLSKMTVRLKKISTATNGVASDTTSTSAVANSSTYTLSYAAGAGSRLTQVVECSTSGLCLPPIIFGWSDTSSSGWWSNYYNGSPISPGKECLSGDFNGDGRADFACYTNATSGWQLYLSKGTSNDIVQWAGGVTPQLPMINQCVAGDFNGDAKTDIACYSGSGGVWNVQLSTGKGWTLSSWGGGAAPSSIVNNYCFKGDFNGDARTDIACYFGASGSWSVQLSTGAGWTLASWGGGNAPSIPVTNECLTGDFNGDGYSDISCRIPGVAATWRTQFSSGSGWNLTQTTTGIDASTPISSRCVGGDFNGDGSSDIGCFMADSYQVQTMTSSGWVKSTYPNGIKPSDGLGATPSTQCVAGDFNGDARTDVACVINGSWKLQMSTDTDFAQSTWVDFVPSLPISDNCLVSDWSGAGVASLTCYNQGGSNWYKLTAKTNAPENSRITSITTAQASADVAISYYTMPAAYGSGMPYNTDLKPVYPFVSPTPPVYIVYSTSIRTATRFNVTQYKYGNNLVEVGSSGRGRLGFQWMQVKNPQPLVVRTCYRQDWPYVGLVDKTIQVTSDTVMPTCEQFTLGSLKVPAGPPNFVYMLGVSINKYKFLATDSAGATITCTDPDASSPKCAASAVKTGSRYQVYAFDTVAQANDWDGTTFTALPATHTTQSQDVFGNVTNMFTETLNADGVTPSGFNKTLTNVFAPADTSNWYIGRLLKSTLSSASP